MDEIKELVQRRNELQSELNQASRLKKVSIVTEDTDSAELASRKIEKLIIDIEKVDRRIRDKKAEIKARIEETKRKISDIDSRKEELKAQIDFLKNEYVASGEEDVFDAIELKMAELKTYDSILEKLNKIVSGDNEVINGDSDEILEEDNKVVEFVEKEIELGKSYEEIAKELNEKAPSTLDEYVTSDEYKTLRELYRSFYWIDSRGNVENPGSVRSVSLSNGFNIDLEKLEKIDFNIYENVKKLKEIFAEDRKVLKDDWDVQEHYRLNDQFKILEEKCIDMIIPHVKDAYDMHIGNRVLNDRGTDFTAWLVGGIFDLRSSVLNMMFDNFDNKAKKKFLPKDQLREVGDLRFISASDVKKYAKNKGLIVFEEDNKSELTSMFGTDPRDIEEDRGPIVR